MSTIVRSVQGSAEWHEHRRAHRNASETPIVLGRVAVVDAVPAVAVQAGPRRRRKLPRRCCTAPSSNRPRARPMSAGPGSSCDRWSWSMASTRRASTASPWPAIGSWRSSARSRAATRRCGRASRPRKLPEHYQWQVQHQLMVTKADVADVWVFDGSEGVVFPVAPDPSTWPQIHEAWDKFTQFVTTKSPPPLAKGDVRRARRSRVDRGGRGLRRSEACGGHGGEGVG